MATGLANLLLGADFTVDDPLCDTLINHIKNHWRMSDPCTNLTNIQPGMIVSDSDDEKLYHYQAAACFEIIQGDTPISDDLQIIGGDGSDAILIPYEETTNDAVIWGLPIDPKRGLIFCDVADIGGDFTGLITPTGFPEINLVDLDLDSRIRFGFTADDKPTILLQSGAYYSLIQETQAEGLAGSDTRLGLDEALRTFILCDRGDINTDFGLNAATDLTMYIFSAAGTNKLYINWAEINASYSLNIKTYNRLRHILVNDIPVNHYVSFESNANVELIDADAEQAWMYLEPKINMGIAPATGNYVGLLMDVTETNLGDGSASGNPNALMDLRVSAISKFRTYNTGYVRAGTLSAALADNDTFVTTIPDSWTGIIIVENVTDTTSGVYHIDGAALVVINQNANFTTTQGTNDKINVYIAANLLTVENTWAAAKTVKVFFIGT